MRKRIVFFVAALTSGVALSLPAQSPSVLAAGTRVKLVTPALDAGQQTGKVVEATRDSITFISDGAPVTRSFAIADLTSIEVSAGKDTHIGRDALYGLGIGGAAGALLGAASYKKPDDCFLFCETRSGDTVAGAIAGGLLGTLIGGFIIGNIDRTERWVPLRKMASILVMPADGGLKLALSARF